MSAESENAHGAGMPPGFPELWESVTRARMDIAELKGMVKGDYLAPLCGRNPRVRAREVRAWLTSSR